MRIALDYDGTYTSDPTLWENFVAMAKQRGHEVKIITARGNTMSFYHNLDNKEVEDAAVRMGIDVVYCDGVQKQDRHGADIWIDDRPDMVLGLEQIDTLYQMHHGR